MSADVRVIAWDQTTAVAVVDGIRCRVRRTGHRVRWICDRHGTGPEPHCLHLEAFAATPPPTDRRAP